MRNNRLVHLSLNFFVFLMVHPAEALGLDPVRGCLAQEDNSAAIASCEVALKAVDDPKVQANILVRECVAYAALADLTSAKAACARASSLDSKNFLAFSNLGAILLREGRYFESLEFFDRAISINKGYANAYGSKCYALNYLRQSDDAISACTRAIAIEPKTPSFYISRGNAYLWKKSLESAEADYSKALSLSSGDLGASIGLAKVFEKRRDFSSALKVLDEAKLSGTLEDATALNNRCWVRAISSSGKVDLETALADCQAAYKINSADWIADSIAFVNLKLGNLEEAKANYILALARSPYSATSKFGLGIAKMRMGDKSGDQDIQAAVALDAKVKADFAAYGIAMD